MRAIAVNEWGGRDRMELLEVEPPPVAPDGVLVRVRAAGLNPVDYKVREGYLADKFPHHFPVVLGWDVAGTVEAVGPAVTWFKPGDLAYGDKPTRPGAPAGMLVFDVELVGIK